MGSQDVGNVSDSLSRQGSLYSLTLNEFQSQLGNLGKPLGSMNLDELLRTVWIAESNENGGPHPTTTATHHLASGSSQTSSLNRQTNFSLSPDISKKTVEEVWQEINGPGRNNGGGGERYRGAQQQSSLGEMTLENFLTQAGVVVEPNGGNNNTNNNSVSGLIGADPTTVQHGHWIRYSSSIPQQHTHYMAGHHVSGLTAGNLFDSANYSDAAMSPGMIGALSDTQAPARKRVAASGDVVEKKVERRQKRMIKNRESAARSRARKQAYTNELEIKVSRLQEENERLRRMRVKSLFAVVFV